MTRKHYLPLLLTAILIPFNQGFAQQSVAAPGYSYADLADLADPAPLVLHALVKKTIALPPERATDVPANKVRLYVEAEILALVRGRDALPQAIRYIIDLPRDARGKPPKLKKQQVLLFARANTARPGEIQLVAPDAQLPYDPATDARLRGIIREMVAIDAPPRITGVREALNVAGNLTDEGETQIFLATQSGDPVSLTVIRRPGLQPRWAVSLSEIVDDSARVPMRDSLLWYRLACSLPDGIATNALLSDDSSANEQARRDYQFVKQSLGPCVRTRR